MLSGQIGQEFLAALDNTSLPDSTVWIILTSNKAFSDWGEVFAGDAIMASAGLDRLLHRCTIINIRGESFRLKEKRQAARSTLNAMLHTGSLSPSADLSGKEEIAMP